MYFNLIVFTVIFRLIGCSFGPRVTSDENVSLFTPLELRTLVLLWVGKNKISQGHHGHLLSRTCIQKRID